MIFLGRFEGSYDIKELKKQIFYNKYLGTDDSLSVESISTSIYNNALDKENIKTCIDQNKVDSKFKILTKVTEEAIFDAGYNPIEFQESKIGVFISVPKLLKSFRNKSK